ncbi:TlpA family protein disulfide reductase [Chitinophaga oryzae]|nr:TlpA disulfide reductase family protein [Chitinophaga oryzae]
MKQRLRNMLLCFAAAAALPAFSQVKISGRLPPAAASNLLLTMPGQEPLKVQADKNGRFAVTTGKIPRGVYQLGAIGPVYLEPGYALEIIPEGDGFRFKGKGSTENNLIRAAADELKKYVPMYNGDYLYSFYQISLPEFRQKMAAWQQAAANILSKSDNAYFRELQNTAVAFRAKNIAQDWWLNYGVDSLKRIAFQKMLEAPKEMNDTTLHVRLRKAFNEMRTKTLTRQERSEIDSFSFHGWSMNNDDWFRNLASYREALDGRITNIMYAGYQKEMNAGQPQEMIKLQIISKEITSPFIREYYQYQQTANILKMNDNPAEVDSLYKNFMAKVTNEVYRKSINEVYANLKKYGDNQPAPDFEFENVHGAKVKLSNLKGKYVYIDVWATWCGPCKREIPFLTTMEKSFAGKNIHFVSLSVDRQADKEKWQAYVKDNQLKGEQLITDNDFNVDFIKKFNINAIPRFILIGPDGKIVSANAKRPSDPALQQQLNGLL